MKRKWRNKREKTKEREDMKRKRKRRKGRLSKGEMQCLVHLPLVACSRCEAKDKKSEQVVASEAAVGAITSAGQA